MADYGLKIFDSSGTAVLDTTDKIARLRYSVVATAGNSSSTVLSDISGKTTVEFAFGLATGWKIPHSVSRSGTTISWTARTMEFHTSCDTFILVFLYD